MATRKKQRQSTKENKFLFFDIRSGDSPKTKESEELEKFNDDVNLTMAAIGDIPISRLFEMRLLEALILTQERVIGALPHINLRRFKLSEEEIYSAYKPLIRAAKECALKVRDIFVLPRTRLPANLVKAIIALHKEGLPFLKVWPDEGDEITIAARDYFISHFIRSLPEMTMRRTWELEKYSVPQGTYGLLALAVLLKICTKPKPNGQTCNLRHFPGSGLPACIYTKTTPHWCKSYPTPKNPDPNCSLKSY